LLRDSLRKYCHYHERPHGGGRGDGRPFARLNGFHVVDQSDDKTGCQDHREGVDQVTVMGEDGKTAEGIAGQIAVTRPRACAQQTTRTLKARHIWHKRTLNYNNSGNKKDPQRPREARRCQGPRHDDRRLARSALPVATNHHARKGDLRRHQAAFSIKPAPTTP